jgi:beta-lactamase class A
MLFVAGAAAFVAGLLAGGSAMWLYSRGLEGEPPPATAVREARQGGFRLINPLLECDVGIEQKELQRFEDEVEELVGNLIETGKADSVSVYFRDLNNGPWFGINERERFSPASLLKLPVLIAYLKLAEFDPSILTQSYTMTAEALRGPADPIPPSRKLVVGRSYQVEELLRQMIVLSDNQALFLLVRNPQLHFERPFIDLKIPVPSNVDAEDFMDIKTYASFFRILYNASYLSNELSEAALKLLSQSEFKQGLAAGVPAGVPVAHKYGERVISRPAPEGPLIQLHDCGIVYYPQRPYLLCVMTRGDDVAELAGSIRDISRLVYGAVDLQFSRSVDGTPGGGLR